MNEAAACAFPAMVTTAGGGLYGIVDDHSAGQHGDDTERTDELDMGDSGAPRSGIQLWGDR